MEKIIRKYIKEQIKTLAEAEVKGDIVNLHYKIDVYASPSDGDMSSVIDYVENNEVVNKYNIKVEVGTLESGPKEDESSVYVKFTIDRRKTAAMTAIRLLREIVIEFIEKKIGAVVVDIEARDFKPDGPSDDEYDQMAQQSAMDDRRQQGLDPGLEEIARDLGYLNELNSYEMGKLPDFELLRKNVSQMLGVEVDDDVRSGMYDGKEGYYSRISPRDLIFWEKEQIEKLKQAFKKTNFESDDYEFEYDNIFDFEEDPGERTYPAGFGYFATEKKYGDDDRDNFPDLEESDKDDYGRSVSGKDKRTFVDPKDLTPAARAKKLAGMKEEKSKEDQLKIARAAFEKAEMNGDIRGQELALAAIDLIKGKRIKGLGKSSKLKETASELGYLNEITVSGGQEAARNYPPTENPGDMFAQKEVEDLLPASFASRNQELKARIQAHANWAKQGQYNNTFVGFKVNTVTDGNNMYLIAMSQHYNGNYTDFKNPKFTEIRVKELDDESDMERDLGLYVVDTTALMQDLKELKTIKTVS